MSTISVKLPLRITERDGAYMMNTTLAETVKQNFKMLLLTNPGERVMDPEFGVGLSRFIFELAGSGLADMISDNIQEQVTRYMPFIEVDDTIISSKDSHMVKVTVSYIVLPTAERDILDVSFMQNEI